MWTVARSGTAVMVALTLWGGLSPTVGQITEDPSGAITSSSRDPGERLVGSVVDSVTLSPIPQAHVVLVGQDRTRLTDANGRFTFRNVAPGHYQIEIDHVAYRTALIESVRVEAGGPARRLNVKLVAFTYSVDEVTVAEDRVAPTTSARTTRYSIPVDVLRDPQTDTVTDAVKLLPGVTVNGDRLYFRGVGFEHVQPRIDGVVARDPLKGQWIMPPPDALVSADYIAGAFGGEYGQALGGVFDMRLADGQDRLHARAAYKTDELNVNRDEAFGTHHVRLGVNGPLGRSNLFYSLNWSGQLTDTYLVYDRGKTHQDLLGTFGLVDRMRGNQTGSFKLSIRPRAAPWTASLSAVHTASRRKPYHHHYSASGTVEFDWIGGQQYYQGFIPPDQELVDNAEFFEGPRNVPTYARSSTLLIGNYRRLLGERGLLRVNGRVAQHDIDTRIREQTFEILAPTNYDQQVEPYFAVHGGFPDLEDGRSEEAGATADLQVRLGSHEIRVGGGAAMGRHRYFTVDRLSTGAVLPVGSLDDHMQTIDSFAYVEENWHTGILSAMHLSLRYDRQQIRDYPGDATGETWSPRLGFHHPMTDRSAMHVQAGVLYTFPTLQRHFLYSDLRGVTLTAQRTRQIELGFQHHFSSKLVGHLTTYVHGLSDVIFSERQIGELDYVVDFLGGDIRQAPQLTETDSYGVELTFDVRPVRQLHGSFSVTGARVQQGGRLLPWDRNLVVHGWLRFDSLRGFRSTATWRWSKGTPFRICDDPRGCDESTITEGRLPDLALIDLSLQFSPSRRSSPLYLFFEVRNVLDQESPEFAFSTYPVSAGPQRITANDFLRYYVMTGETGGYARRTQTGEFDLVDVGNPRTRMAGRSIRLGIDASW